MNFKRWAFIEFALLLFIAILLSGRAILATSPNHFKLTSPVFENGQTIPKDYTSDGQGESPPLKWEGIPKGTQQLVLVVEDPDTAAGVYTHWVAYGISPDSSGVPQGVPPGKGKISIPVGLSQGINSMEQQGYTPPNPPPGDKPHHYQFKLFALDKDIRLNPGLSESKVLTQIRDHVIAEADLVGMFGKATH